MESTFATIVFVLVWLHPTNFGAIQHAYCSICYDTATRQPSAVTEGLPDTQSKRGPYEIGTIRTSCWLFDVRYGHDTARHSTCGWCRQQIYGQPGRPHWNVVKHILRYLVLTKEYDIKFGPNEPLRPSWLHRLGLWGVGIIDKYAWKHRQIRRGFEPEETRVVEWRRSELYIKIRRSKEKN
jgi:hypothetical protein